MNETMLSQFATQTPDSAESRIGDECSDRSNELSATVVPNKLFWMRRLTTAIASGMEWLFGAIAIFVGLSFLAALPLLQLLSFGYLLESAARVARSGRIRDAFIGVRLAARLGSMAIGCWLILLPLRLIASLANSAEIIAPQSDIARRWRIALIVLTVLVVGHLITACARGGRLRHFFWPFGTPSWLRQQWQRRHLFTLARDAVWDFVAALRLPYYFRLGALGFVGTLAWLIIPVSLIALGRRIPPVGFLGGLLLGIVSLALPFLQIRFAAENRFRAFLEYRAIRQRFRRAPWAFAFAALLTLTFAVPLYLLKIEMIPREVAWLPSLIFLAFCLPARTLTAWAYFRSQRRDSDRHWFFRWTSRLAMFPIGLLYAIIVFFTQYTAWQGIWSLYEQHAFLLPVPFLNM